MKRKTLIAATVAQLYPLKKPILPACLAPSPAPRVDVRDYMTATQRAQLDMGLPVFDSNTAISAAIAAAEQMGGNVYLPAGTFTGER